MIHLAPEQMELVRKILRFHLPQGRKVLAFGSRVTGVRLKSHSDLDLCVMGDEPLSSHDLVALRDGFTVSNLPMRVDVVDWADTAPNFQAIIKADCEEIVF